MLNVLTDEESHPTQDYPDVRVTEPAARDSADVYGLCLL